MRSPQSVLLVAALVGCPAAGCAPAVESGPSPSPEAPPSVAHATLADACWIDTSGVVTCAKNAGADLPLAKPAMASAPFGNPAAYTFGAEDGHGVFRCLEWEGTSHGVTEVHSPDASPLAAIVRGDGFACGLAADGRASCTGAIPTTGWGPTGPMVPGFDASGRVTAFDDKKVIDLKGGVYQVCGLLEDGSVVCFGTSEDFALGAEGQKAPVAVPGIAPDIVQLGVGHDLACVRSAEGEAFKARTSPTRPGPARRGASPSPRSWTSCEHNACARDTTNTVWCWGDNEGGESGLPAASPPPGWVAPAASRRRRGRGRRARRRTVVLCAHLRREDLGLGYRGEGRPAGGRLDERLDETSCPSGLSRPASRSAEASRESRQLARPSRRQRTRQAQRSRKQVPSPCRKEKDHGEGEDNVLLEEGEGSRAPRRRRASGRRIRSHPRRSRGARAGPTRDHQRRHPARRLRRPRRDPEPSSRSATPSPKSSPPSTSPVVDRLNDCALLGAWYAHLVALPASNGPTQVAALDAEAIPLRENLLADAEALARRGLLDSEAVAHIRTGQGHVDRATDLVALSALFSAHWDDVKTKTAATEAEVARAGELGPLLLNALGVRRSGQPVDAKESAFMRARCFTLFFRAYDQCRRAVSYLRWSDGDADRVFAPSLYAGRGGRTASGPRTPDPQPANSTGGGRRTPELPAPAPASSPVAQPAPAKPAS